MGELKAPAKRAKNSCKGRKALEGGARESRERRGRGGMDGGKGSARGEGAGE